MRKFLSALILLFYAASVAAQSAPLSPTSTVLGSLTAAGSSCAVTNACAQLHQFNSVGLATTSISVTLAGTWAATAQFEASGDNGTTWQAINGTPLPSGTAVSSATANGTWTFTTAGLTDVRVRCSAFTSGSISVTIQGSTPATVIQNLNGGNGVSFVPSIAGLNCVPGVTNPVELTVSPYTVYYCLSTNTWTPIVNLASILTVRSALFISDQGTACTNGELALSAGWQSTGSATVTAVAGTGQTCSWTITTGTTTAANPTVTDTLTNALPSASTRCWMFLEYGPASTHTAAAGEGFAETTLSAMAPVFTFNGTPTAAGKTYLVVRTCGP